MDMTSAVDGRSDYLSAIVAQGRQVTLPDVGEALNHSDRMARELMTKSAQMVGETLALIVNFFNPSLIVIGGSVPDNGDVYLTRIRQVILSRSLPLATRELRIERSPTPGRRSPGAPSWWSTSSSPGSDSAAG